MSAFTSTLRALVLTGTLTILTTRAGHAQEAANQPAKPRHPMICAKGVRVYTERTQVPVPHDTLRLPPADGPIRVTSPEEAAAAELTLRGRAGSVGATGLLVVDQVSDDGGARRIGRSATAVFVPSDSARALQACR